jgi:5-hydroxyisourate hydrolase
MASLSTHVLDTVHGKPAQGVVIELHLLKKGQRRLLQTAVTNADGRPSNPLSDGGLEIGTYELHFMAGDYFRKLGVTVPDPPFLDDVVIRFGIAEAEGHYHVPLLLSTYGYSTYRGS